jgi:hypothetical protein
MGRGLPCGSAACPPSIPCSARACCCSSRAGPGAGIAKIIGGDNRREQHVDEFRRQWDVVSFDPRGVEQSSPHPLFTGSCTARDGAAAEFEAIAQGNAAFIESCVAATGELMTHLSAMDTARPYWLPCDAP